MDNKSLLPKPRLQMPSHSDGEQAQTDLPLPEKEIPAHAESAEPLPVIEGEVKGNKLKYLLLVVLTILVLVGIAFGAYALNKKSNSPPKSSTAVPTSAEKTDFSDFFIFSPPSSPEKITLENLPNNGYVSGSVLIGDKLWYTGNGNLIEYDTKSNKILSYSNPKKGNCNYGNIVYVNGDIYVSCSVKNLGILKSDFKDYQEFLESQFAIYKIDPINHKVEKVFTPKDGLANTSNYEFFLDGDDIWIKTFRGVGKINTKTNKVDFYHDELGIEFAGGLSVDHIFVDDDYVWVVVGSNAETLGGMAVYNKKTKKWTNANPTTDSETFDLGYGEGTNAIKKIPGGIKIAYNSDGIIGLTEKTYNYSTGTWSENPKPVTADSSIYIQNNYPKNNENVMTYDEKGLTQIKLADSGKIIKIDGRTNFKMGPFINGKKVLFTDAGAEYVDNISPFRHPFVKFTHRLPIAPTGEGKIYNYLVDESHGITVIVDSDCAGRGCGNAPKIYLIDLKNGKLIKQYSALDKIPEAEKLQTNMDLDVKENIITVTDINLVPLFTINLENNQIINNSK